MTQIQPPRGTQDILAPVSERFQAHEQLGQMLFERAGYRRIITPMFEDTSLFLRGVGEGSDIVSKEMYTFSDRSENSLTLRPEGTAPVMRAVITNRLADAGVPVKVWYSAAMFRYDRPQKGRYRQHHQLGIEAIGTEDPAVDAEVIVLARQMLRAAGVTELTLLLNSIGHPGCRAEYLPRLVEFLRARESDLDEDCRRRTDTNPLRVFDCKNPRDQEILRDAPTIEQALCDDCRAHFEAVQGYLKDAGVDYTPAPRLVRGLDYYTRTTFEFQTPVLEAAQSTVCGGGRYDGLSEAVGGPRLPGIGFGSGIERVLLAADASGAATSVAPLDAYVIPFGARYDEAKSLAWRLLLELREAGARADMAFEARKLDKMMRRASDQGARYAVLIAADEVESGHVKIKNMATREETVLPPADAVRAIVGQEH